LFAGAASGTRAAIRRDVALSPSSRLHGHRTERAGAHTVRETEATPSAASFTGSDDENDDDQFDDVELANLFAPLAHSDDEA